MKFCGAAALQHRRFASVKGGFGVAAPTRLTKGAKRKEGELWATGRILLSFRKTPPIEHQGKAFLS